MITIVEATKNDYATIRNIAYKTWPVTYGAILSKAQLEYMLNAFYSEEALKESVVDKGHLFLLLLEDQECIGFASYEHNYQNKNITRIHKIYLLLETQGKGLGKLLIEFITKLAILNQSNSLSLNVNRYNKALTFYQKIGFEIKGEENIALDFGYLMEDYIMEKVLLQAL